MTGERGSHAESKNCEILLFTTADRHFGTKVKCPTGRASFLVKFPTVRSLTRVKCPGIARGGGGMGGFGIDWYITFGAFFIILGSNFVWCLLHYIRCFLRYIRSLLHYIRCLLHYIRCFLHYIRCFLRYDRHQSFFKAVSIKQGLRTTDCGLRTTDWV